MRADALRRRRAIVREARRLVAERGADVALDVVADAAGVGIATLYRNFPARAALLDEVVVALLGDVRFAAVEAYDALPDDPVAAWEGFVGRLVDFDLGAFSAALADHVAAELSEAVREAQADTLVQVDALLDRVKDVALVRHDFSATELVIAVGMLTRPQPEGVRRVAPHLTERLVEVLLAGLRPARP